MEEEDAGIPAPGRCQTAAVMMKVVGVEGEVMSLILQSHRYPAERVQRITWRV